MTAQDREAGSDDGARIAAPCVMVICGAAGDLTKRLVVPALYNLVNAKRLREGSEAPVAADEPLARDGRAWRLLD